VKVLFFIFKEQFLHIMKTSIKFISWTFKVI